MNRTSQEQQERWEQEDNSRDYMGSKTERLRNKSGNRRTCSICGGRPLRTLYAWDPLRTAILLLGGDKTGDDRWYEKFVAVADQLYDKHLDELREEGKL
jgi:hypothetical protein